MGRPIVIVHGWSASSAGMRVLGAFLRDNLSAEVSVIDLADWLSMNDSVTYNDLSKAMNDAWMAQPNLASAKEVDVVTHSTGALVVRDWMTAHFPSPSACPIKRLLMLAPANFGSPLAHMGTSFLAKAFKGGPKTDFQTGAELLSGLELASSYSWDLAQRDVFATQAWYGAKGILATVLVGSDGYPGIQGIVNEVGSDGTVRVSTANLNAARGRLVFGVGGKVEQYSIETVPTDRQAAFRVIPGLNHGSITTPDSADSEHGQLIIGALSVLPKDFAQWRTDLGSQTDALYADPERLSHAYYHGYQNTVVRAYDDIGNPVQEYLVQFYEKKRRVFSLTDVGFIFQQSIIADEHNFKANHAYRCFYIDVSLIAEQCIDADLCMNVDPQPLFSNGQPVGYSDVDSVPLDEAARSVLFQPNRTLLLDVQFAREMAREKVFDIQPMA